ALVLLGGGPALVVAAGLLIWGLRAPRPLGRVFTLLAVSAASAGLALVLRADPVAGPVAWAGVVVGVVAAAGLALALRGGAAELADRDADVDRLRLLAAAVTASGDGVMVVEAPAAGEPGPRVVFANPAFEQIMGYSAEEVVGLSPSVFCLTRSATNGAPVLFDPDADAEAAALEAIRAALRGTDPVRMDLPARRKDGSRVWAEWQGVPVANAAGRDTHWGAVPRDTTRRRELE